MDELLTDPACGAGRCLVIVEAAAAAGGATLPPLAARLELTGVPLAFAQRAVRVGVLIQAGDREAALAAGTQAVADAAAAADRDMQVTRNEIHPAPGRPRVPGGALAAHAWPGRW